MKKISGVSMVLAMAMLVWTNPILAGPLPGAIFTTLEDGSEVNQNIYEQAEDVYLDGGPGLNAPIGAAGLPGGDYYFQVTDPSGKILLSLDPVKCRKFHVNSYGVIDQVYSAVCSEKIRGKPTDFDCAHNTGIDIDHSESGAITVQLYPYSQTPNNGNVYKVWVTPVEEFAGDPEKIDNPGYFHGFIPSWSKTDNFKVRKGKPFTPPIIIIRKIDDSNANGIADPGELEVNSWPVSVEDPLGVENIVYTPANVMAVPSGIWILSEALLDNWMATGPDSVEVTVVGLDKEVHEVVFLNIRLGSITVCKGYDQNADGISDNIPVSGFKICLEGTAVNGTVVSKSGYTDSSGCVTFDDLLPGNYTVREVLASNWYASTATTVSLALAEGENKTVEFLNYCKGTVAMHTKGFWQNQGCNIVTKEDLDYLAGLPPYKGGEVITKGQDNCGSVHCPDSVTLPLANANELGCYIVALNSQDDRIGLAQQLMAFILNCRHGLDSLDATLILDIGTISAQDIISGAIDAWLTGEGVKFWQEELDAINNTALVDFISGSPCSITY